MLVSCLWNRKHKTRGSPCYHHLFYSCIFLPTITINIARCFVLGIDLSYVLASIPACYLPNGIISQSQTFNIILLILFLLKVCLSLHFIHGLKTITPSILPRLDLRYVFSLGLSLLGLFLFFVLISVVALVVLVHNDHTLVESTIFGFGGPARGAPRLNTEEETALQRNTFITLATSYITCQR